MTTYSQSDLATLTLKILGVVGAEETPSAADLSYAIDINASEIAMLSALGMPIWNGSDMAVPLEYMNALARRCGIALAPSFGLADIATATLAMREAERPLAIMASPRLLNPTKLRTDEATQYRGKFNFTSGA